MTPFDFLNILFEKKQIPSDEDIEKYCNQYVINMTLSCDKQFTEIAHEMSKLKLTNKMYFECLYYGLPKGKRFIKYNASKAKKEQDIQYLMQYYSCSQQTAKEYIQVISDKDMKNVREYFENRGPK